MEKTVEFGITYVNHMERWKVVVRDGEHIVKQKQLNWPIIPDYTGKGFEQSVNQLTEELSEYGITKEQIEVAILETCQREEIEPPKYLR